MEVFFLYKFLRLKVFGAREMLYLCNTPIYFPNLLLSTCYIILFLNECYNYLYIILTNVGTVNFRLSKCSNGITNGVPSLLHILEKEKHNHNSVQITLSNIKNMLLNSFLHISKRKHT